MKVNKKSIFAAAAVLLLAAALFVGAGAAATEVSTFADLKSNLETGDANLKLTADITFTDGIIISGVAASTLDLNGHTITVAPMTNGTSKSSKDVTAKKTFYIYRSKLDVTGTGKICDTDNDEATIFRVYGSQDDEANATELTIDTDVIVASVKNWPVSVYSDAYGGFFVTKTGSPDNTANAYNVIVTIKGKLTSDEAGCVTINGNVKNADTTKTGITITIDGATLTAPKYDAVYAAGKASWDIENSTLTGATAVYIKAGDVTITDSTIKGNGAFAAPTANCNGGDPTGDAIILDTNKSYAGDVGLTVVGDSKVTSVNGYAVQEAITKDPSTQGTNTKALSLAGEFKGGQNGLKTSADFQEKATAKSVAVTYDTNVKIYQSTDADPLPEASSGTTPEPLPFTPGEKSGEVEVTSTAALEYSLIIPADVDLTYGVTKEAIVGVQIITLGEGTQIVKVNMASANFASSKFYLKSTDSESAEYTIKNDGTAVTTSPAEILSVMGDESEEQTTTLSLALAEKLPTAGTYSDTLTFTGIVVTMS